MEMNFGWVHYIMLLWNIFCRSRSRDRHDEHPRIKREPEDRGYERRHHRTDDRRHHRPRSDDERRPHRGGDRHEGGNRPPRVKQEPRDDNNFEFGRNATDVKEEVKEKEKPDFKLSGKLTADTNTFKGVVIKYNEPPEAKKPKRRWRLYPFKNGVEQKVLHIHRQSAFLLGRDRKIADIPIDHPSCSKQHAVLQYRAVEYTRADESRGRRVRPYIIDLDSANGTFVNNQKIEAQRYVELFVKDVLKFGFSSREYVMLHDSVDTTEIDDENNPEPDTWLPWTRHMTIPNLTHDDDQDF